MKKSASCWLFSLYLTILATTAPYTANATGDSHRLTTNHIGSDPTKRSPFYTEIPFPWQTEIPMPWAKLDGYWTCNHQPCNYVFDIQVINRTDPRIQDIAVVVLDAMNLNVELGSVRISRFRDDPFLQVWVTVSGLPHFLEIRAYTIQESRDAAPLPDPGFRFRLIRLEPQQPSVDPAMPMETQVMDDFGVRLELPKLPSLSR